jgi:hypothetical protein
MIPQKKLSTPMAMAKPTVNFDVIGSGLSVGGDKTWEFKRIFHNGSDILWSKSEPHFGSAIFPDFRERKIYLYGTCQGVDQIQKTYLARVDFDKIEQLDAYEYLVSSKPEWSPYVKDAKFFLPTRPAKSPFLTINICRLIWRFIPGGHPIASSDAQRPISGDRGAGNRPVESSDFQR